MNHIAVIILITILIEFFLNLISDILNLSKLSTAPPPELSDIYDAAQYGKSQDYLRANTQFGWGYATANLTVLLLFWFGKGFPLLDAWLQEMNFGKILTGLLFVGILALLKALIDLPFSIYSTFVIEEKFGFNKTTFRTFLLDRIKGLALAILIGVPLLAGILAFFEYAGAHAWLYCWMGVVIFLLIVQYVAPTWIMPLFNKFKPIESGELKTAILAYARKIGFSLANVFIMDGSKRSSKSNAFFTGFGRHRRIVLFDTLINQTSVNELVAILAHEMGHYKKHHITLSLLIGIVHTGLLFFLLSFFLSYQGLFDAFYMARPTPYAGLLFFSMLYTPMELFLGVLMQIFSRRNEYSADRFAAETTAHPEYLVSALKKLTKNNLSNLTPHSFYVFMNYSHPPLLERIHALSAFQQKTGRDQ